MHAFACERAEVCAFNVRRCHLAEKFISCLYWTKRVGGEGIERVGWMGDCGGKGEGVEAHTQGAEWGSS